jgi:CRISPR-associated protein (TIGR03985 family)
MNYRHGKDGGNNVEADVIMRLRSWGHNVEILCPPDLRQRMKEDYQKAWKIYQDN